MLGPVLFVEIGAETEGVAVGVLVVAADVVAVAVSFPAAVGTAVVSLCNATDVIDVV